MSRVSERFDVANSLMKMAPRHRLDTRKTRGLPLTDAGKPRTATVCRSHRERKVYFQIRVLEFRREDFPALFERERLKIRIRENGVDVSHYGFR